MKKQSSNSGTLCFNLKKIFIFLILMFAIAANSKAQTPQYYNYNTQVGGNSFPFGQSAGKEVQWLVRAGELNQPAGVPSGQVITSIWFFMASTGTVTYTNLTIKLGQDTITTLPTGAFYTGSMTTVFFRASHVITTALGTWQSFTLDTPFPYDTTRSLIIDVGQCLYTGAGPSVYQTGLTGFRRTWSVGGCPFVFSSQDANVAHFGVSVTPNVPMYYGSSTTLQTLNGAPVPPNTINNQIIQVQVMMNGVQTPPNLTRLAFNTAGTTNPAGDITNAKVYYTGTSNVFSTTTQFGSTTAGPNGAFSVSGTQAMQVGTNYFWLAYDVPNSAPMGDLLDARCDTVVVADTSRIPLITTPAGFRQVDNYGRGTYVNNGSAFGLYITNVTFESINNSSGFDPDGNFPYAYKFYQSPVPNIEQGSTYPVSISEPSATNANAFAIWIDWNNNNSFQDAGEYYSIGILPTGGGTTITANITVPQSAGLGNHRMRVRSNFSAIPTAAQDAAVLQYGETEDYLVNVLAATNMTYSSSTTTQTVTSTVFAPANNVQMIGVQILMTGTLSPQSATSITLNTNGSTNPPTDISRARLWYTGTNSSFATTSLFGNTFVSPNGSFTIIGNQQLAQGTNYFWLTYDVPGTAVTNNVLDAECNSLIVASVSRIPTVQAPAGSRLIAGTRMAGNYTIPGNYPNFTSAITDLNSRGTSAPVTFVVQEGFVDTAANLVINTTGSSTSPIVFKSSGASDERTGRGVNPVIVAGVGTSTTTDGIIKINGGDYITINGIDLQENPANLTTTEQMEWGYALVKPNGTDGCQNVTIKNCTITLNKTNTNSTGIYSHNHLPTSTTTFIVTTTAGANSNNTFQNNTITNSYIGIYINGYIDASPFTFYDQNNNASSNNISNYGGTATTAYGIYNIYQNGLALNGNTINSSGGTNSTGTLYGIFCSTMSNSTLTISNNTVTIVSDGTTSSIYGINFGNGSAGTSNNINILNNTVQNSTYLTATSGAMYHIYCNATNNNLTVSGNRVIGNTYGNAASTGQAYYIYNLNQAVNSVAITNNLDSGNTVLGTSSYALYHISNQVTTNNVTITGNRIKNNIITGTSSTATSYGIINTGGTLTCVYNNNIVSDNTIPSTSTHVWYCMYNGTPAPASDYMGNTVSGNSGSGSGLLYGMAYLGATPIGGTANINNNTVTNLQKLTGTGTGEIRGIYQGGSGAGTYNINNNTVTNISSAAASPIYGIYQFGSPPNNVNINNNRVGNLSNSGIASIWGINHFPTGSTISTMSQDSIFNISSAGGTVYGMLINSGATWNIFRNKISGVTSHTGTTGVANGFFSQVTVASTINFYNNFISNITAPASTSIAPAVSGINISTGTTTTVLNIYYNTVYLKDSSSSATTFGTAGIFASTTPTVNLANNVVVNNSVPGPTGGNTAAYRRSSTILTSYGSSSNNNCFYAGTPSANRLIFFDGTNSDQTLAAYTTRVVPRDNVSATENPPFVNGAAPPFDLRIQTGTGTQLESGGKVIASPVNITSDIYNTNRYPNAGYPVGGFTPIAPDMGAHEFGGLNADVVPPSISYTPLGNGGTTNRLFSNVAITDASGLNTTAGTKPRCYYKRSTDGNVINDNTSGTDGWKYVEAAGTTSPFSFTIDYSLLNGGTGVTAGQVVQYFVIAQDLAGTPNVGSQQATYAVAPTSVALIGANTPIANMLSYTIVTNVFSGSINVGTAETYTSLTGAGGLFASINAGTVTGNITAMITSDMTEDGTNSLNPFNETGPGGYTLTIVPATGSVKTISGAVAQGMIRFTGSRRVIIDGNGGFAEDRPIDLSGRMAPTKYLLFRNTNISNPTFTFINDAVGNIIKNCTIESNNTSTASGTILFSTTTGTQGNDSNLIQYCDIRDRTDVSATYANGIYSLGTSTTLGQYNSFNRVIGCNIYNYFTDVAALQAGVHMTTGSSNWTIDSCSFYQTVSRSVTVSATFMGVYNATTLAQGHTVTNNFIGGSAPLCGGTAMTYSGAGLYNVYGINLIMGGLEPTSVQGNTIQNISLTTSPAASLSTFFRGIFAQTGWINIGNLSGNTIGSGTGTGSIVLTMNTTASSYTVHMIHHTGFGSIMNNTIGSITFAGNSIGTAGLYGAIHWINALAGQIFPISNNLIGSLSTANSIQVTNLVDAHSLRGLYLQNGAGTTTNVTNNVVANLTSLNPTSAAVSTVYGIQTNNAVNANYTFTQNTVRNLINNSNFNLSATFQVGGIFSTALGQNNYIQNTIFSLYANGTGAGTPLVGGILAGGASTVALGGTVTRNKMYDFRLSGTGTLAPAPLLLGINVQGNCPYTVTNNMVSLSNDDATSNGPMNHIDNYKQVVVENPPINLMAIPKNLEEGVASIVEEELNPGLSADNNDILNNLNNTKPSDANNQKKADENGRSSESTVTTSIAGVFMTSASTGACNYYYNTFYVGGTQPGSLNSWGFVRTGAGPVNLRNNVFVNARSGGSGNYYAIGNQAINPLQGWPPSASNYNVFLTTNSSTMGEWGVANNQTISQWINSSGSDKQSWATNTATITPSALLTNIAAGDLSIQTGNASAWLVSGKGIALAGQNIDFTGDSRVTAITGGCTDIGADEFTATPPSNPVATQTGAPGGGNTSTYTLWGRTLCSIDWGTGGTSYPVSMNVNYFSGVNPTPNITTPNRNSNSYWTVTPASGNLVGTTYSITLNFGDNETFNITSPSTNTLLGKYNTFWQVFPAGSGSQFSTLDWNNLTLTTGGLNTFSTFALSDAALPSIVLVSPAHNSVVSSLSPTLVWSRSAGSTSHRVQLATDSLFNTIIRDTTTADTTKLITGLTDNTNYWWRVNGTNGIGTGAYSQIFKFRVTSVLPPANVNLTVIPGGFYNTATGQLNMKDTIRVYLVDSTSCLRLDSSKGRIDSVTFSMPLSFSNVPTGNYYIFVYHRNHIVIASRFEQNIVRGSTVSYDFTTDSAKAFGFNMIKVSNSPVRWGMIPGDANQDEFVDGLDQTIWILTNGLDGYLAADFNGDSFVDGLDQTVWILFNGNSSFIPCGTLSSSNGTERRVIDRRDGARILEMNINNGMNNNKNELKR